MELASRLSAAWKPLIIGGALTFMYLAVLWKLGYDWWTDDNYSHGLLVPFVIGLIIWHEFGSLKAAVEKPSTLPGLAMMGFAAFLLLLGSMAAVLVAQRLSLVIMIAGVIVFFFGFRLLKSLAVPFFLLILSIPVPQLIFNKIAIPLQLLASRAADKAIRLLDIVVERRGNVLDIVPVGASEVVSLEVVEACSGIRSLMTLITLALILGYLTRRGQILGEPGVRQSYARQDVLRTGLLMLAAAPIALLTNAARVVATGVIAYYFGRETVEGIWHDISGSIVFLSALLSLIGLNIALRSLLRADSSHPKDAGPLESQVGNDIPVGRVGTVLVAVLVCGFFVNWFQYRGEATVERRPLNQIPAVLGTWEQRNEDFRFDVETEKVLRATDYMMRDYYGPGKRLNLYVGYYASQRSGATYHSPLSCLPGTGWEMTDPKLVEISTSHGKKLLVNQYVVRQGEHSEYLIYWYQGRGRTSASEYEDRFLTSLDSLTRRRSDGGMVRIMTPVGKDPGRSLAAAIDLTSHVADNISEFLPD